MKLTFATLLLALVVAPALAADKSDPKIGKTLHDKSCVGCHVSKFGGDGSKMYTRPDHKVQTLDQLAARVRACNNNVGAHWFPEEEAHVAAYLNATFYQIK
ncbi:MAG: cytochrome c [Sulfuricellaceae bacterium]|nr:cytochrome c [Sulfuricellaceae bacterium]